MFFSPLHLSAACGLAVLRHSSLILLSYRRNIPVQIAHWFVICCCCVQGRLGTNGRCTHTHTRIGKVLCEAFPSFRIRQAVERGTKICSLLGNIIVRALFFARSSGHLPLFFYTCLRQNVVIQDVINKQ